MTHAVPQVTYTSTGDVVRTTLNVPDVVQPSPGTPKGLADQVAAISADQIAAVSAGGSDTQLQYNNNGSFAGFGARLNAFNFTQLGPDTYGADGWALGDGTDLMLELYRASSTQIFSEAFYIENNLADLPGNGGKGLEIWLQNAPSAVNPTGEMRTLDI